MDLFSITLQVQRMKVLENRRKLHLGTRFVSAVLIAAFTISFAAPSAVTAKAAVPVVKTLTLNAARKLAKENSDDYENLESAVESKLAAYDSAVKAIKLKEKSMSQFRWSPLLSFKFPEKPDFSEASEFTYKPIALQYEIKVAQHKLQDKIFDINEKVNNLYVNIVVLQETIAFNERRLEAAQEGLSRNEAKLHIGQANKADVDKLKKSVEALNSKLASDKRSLEADKKKLSKMIGIDVTTNYRFQKPYIEATIDRSQLDAIIQYTEDRDETYFEACINETTAKAELSTNRQLMSSKFGSDYKMIANYVNSAYNGNSINKKAFKKDYKTFLEKIDSYWQGKKKICWFIKLPKIWFKGELDGTRYIDDDPYVLYQNVLDYSTAFNEKNAAKDELDQAIEDSFNNYISVRNSYKQYIKDVDDAEANLEKDALKNMLGELSFEEYDSSLSSYQELQNSMLDAMKLYTSTLYSFDRQTCGAISAILSGTDADMQTAVIGESYVEKGTAKGATYTMKSIIQNQEFELALQIPEDFEVEITDYELWIDNVQVGDRTTTDNKLRHLALTKESVTDIFIRLYNGDEFVDDCHIEPSDESGPLNITSGYDIKRDDPNKIGLYELNINETTGMVELMFTMDDQEIKKFKVLTEEDKVLGGDSYTEIDKPLKYIQVLQQSLEELSVEFYDENDQILYTGRFDPVNSVVLKKEED